MAKKLKKLDPKIEKVFKESQVAVLLENINNNFAVVVDGQQALEKRMGSMEMKVDSLEFRMISVENRLGSVEGRLGSVEGRLGSVEGKIDSMEDEMHIGFKTILEELDKKADRRDFIELESRVAKIEAAK